MKRFMVLATFLIISVLVLAACPSPAAAPPTEAPAAAATDTPAATESTAVTSTETTTGTESMTSTETTTGTESMTGTTEMTGTEEMTATESPTTSMEMSGTEGATVAVFESPTLGSILVDGKGMTLYVFDKDEKDKSNCSGGCLKNWPPFTVADESTKVTGEGVTATFATIESADGTYQVTVNGMPLYYYIKDVNPHDTVGQAVGDVWWVVGPDGSKITKK